MVELSGAAKALAAILCIAFLAFLLIAAFHGPTSASNPGVNQIEGWDRFPEAVVEQEAAGSPR